MIDVRTILFGWTIDLLAGDQRPTDVCALIHQCHACLGYLKLFKLSIIHSLRL